jgi:50S ribosomal subunit-associated GTPase HflX
MLTTLSPQVRSSTYLGKGQVERVASLAHDLGADRVFINAELTAGETAVLLLD